MCQNFESSFFFWFHLGGILFPVDSGVGLWFTESILLSLLNEGSISVWRGFHFFHSFFLRFVLVEVLLRFDGRPSCLDGFVIRLLDLKAFVGTSHILGFKV